MVGLGNNDYKNNECIYKTKIKLHYYFKSIKYYYSKNLNHYINDKNCGVSGGKSGDYKIEKINII